MQYFYMKKLEFDCEFDNTFWTIQYRKWSLYIWSYSIINQKFFTRYGFWPLNLPPCPILKSIFSTWSVGKICISSCRRIRRLCSRIRSLCNPCDYSVHAGPYTHPPLTNTKIFPLIDFFIHLFWTLKDILFISLHIFVFFPANITFHQNK